LRSPSPVGGGSRPKGAGWGSPDLLFARGELAPSAALSGAYLPLQGRWKCTHTSNKSSPAKLRPLLNKLKPRFRLVAHQPLDRFIGVLAVAFHHRDLKQGALLRVHGGFLQLRRHHLAEPLEAADFDLGVGVEFFFQDGVAVLVVAGVKNSCRRG